MRDRPQRLSSPANPGALFKRVGFTRIKLKEIGERDQAYLSLVRQCCCVKCGMDPAGEAAHVRQQSGVHNKHGGTGKKPADRWALPLCGGCHRIDRDALHNIGENLFWHLLDLDPLALCEKLYAARGTLVAMRATVVAAVASRRS
jgi:hypothetical protein